jgi:4-amino-4-deoxy-L-arabinose transferase-like glycosyltransferase
LCGLAIALAALTRSHLGWLPLLIGGTHLMLTQPRPVLRAPALWLGLMLALVLPLVWFGWQLYLHGEAFLAHHLAYTVENARSIKAARGWQWLTGLVHYPYLLGKLYWPWLPCLLGGLWLAARQWRAGRFDVLNREALWLIVLWLAVAIAPLSLIQHKVLRYLLPVFPVFALLAAFALQHWIPERHKLRVFIVACALFLTGILLVTFTASHRLRAVEMRRLAAVIETEPGEGFPVLLFDNGKASWDYLHQFIWYSDRTCRLQTRLDIVLCHLETCPSRTALLDRATVERLPDAALAVCGESANFVCVRHSGLAGTEPLNRVAALDAPTLTTTQD